MFHRPFRTEIGWGRFQTLRVWLISGCPCRDENVARCSCNANNNGMNETTSSKTQRAGLAGTYLVAAELTLKGFIATITCRNAKAVDILAYNPSLKKTIEIQVKTSSEDSSWETAWGVKGVKDIKSATLHFVFVKLQKGSPHKFYLVPSQGVAKRLKTASGGWEWFEAKEKDLLNWEQFGLSTPI